MKHRSRSPILLSGNEAMGEAAIRAGCFFYAGYPITPQNELTAYMARRMNEERRVFIQAESEIAAINMVYGAAACGFRAMTSSSSPGISLKQEGISYMAGTQLPGVIINVMRGGPGLGNISSSQSDYFQATRGGGHGDYFTPTLAPASTQEAAALTMLSFDIADYYRTPVMVLADAIIGQIIEPLVIPSRSSFTKKLPAKDWILDGAKGRAPNIIRSLLLGEGALEAHNEVLRTKWEAIAKYEQRYETYETDDARILVIAYGSQARISHEAVTLLRQNNIKAGLFRPISLWPFPSNGLCAITKKIKKIVVVEQSLGQMVEDVRLSVPQKEITFLGKAGGGIPQPGEIIRAIKKIYA
ncbi:MAG: 3-methyl-2-oxobutanoate dehydrogenase subunit VorB [Candidatus Omnitrophota bacterium]|nr:3-methyl-2-oxobutanoate dehydrogenase subunit VorB [Candidatus Omnitrophota bacterium]